MGFFTLIHFIFKVSHRFFACLFCLDPFFDFLIEFNDVLLKFLIEFLIARTHVFEFRHQFREALA
ncbi:Uncharacterised protein [Vibrio cholerae]|nr:Uncharacterised protein [Vibrio cholerae]